MLASPWAAIVEGLAVAVALRASGRPGLPAALAAPSALMVGNMLKKWIARPRPGLTRFAHKGRESFPSTHVAGPIAVLTTAWCLAPRTAGWRAALALGSGIAFVAARERVCAGEHWASDVVAGAALGAAIGAALGRFAMAPSGESTCRAVADGSLQEAAP
jgi:membrane-associated phospholipid phosphatase